jgi:hypothetical protein
MPSVSPPQVDVLPLLVSLDLLWEGATPSTALVKASFVTMSSALRYVPGS